MGGWRFAPASFEFRAGFVFCQNPGRWSCWHYGSDDIAADVPFGTCANFIQGRVQTRPGGAAGITAV